MSTVSDLSALEAATTAGEIYLNKGEYKASQQLLFYALTKDENCNKALLVLTQILETLTGRELAVVITEYAYALVTDVAIKTRMTLIRRIALMRQDLISHALENMSELPVDEWQTSTDFVVDEEGIARLTAQVLGRSHTPRQAFEAARLFLGVQAGLMVAKNAPAANVSFKDCYQSENFQHSDYYGEFLKSEKLRAEFV